MLQYLILLPFVFLIACSSGDIDDSNSAEGAFKTAQKYEEDEMWDEALQKYQEVQNKHPYSRLAVEAKLKIADIHFNREAYIEAQNAYQLFKELHPKHSRSDYVTFKLAMSFFHQLPSTIDRDLSLAHKAILYLDEVIVSYPKSEFVEEAKQKKAECRQMLADKEKYIAEFYFIRDMYDSALKRYESLVRNYPDSKDHIQALEGAALSAIEVKDFEKAKVYASRLQQKYADSKEAKHVSEELKSHGF